MNTIVEPVKSAVVIIPTIGKTSLADAVISVLKQVVDTDIKIRILIVIDGKKHKNIFIETVKDKINITETDKTYPHTKTNIVLLQENVGENNFYGHRIYAGFSHLVNEDVVFFLDEDNQYETHHIQNTIDLLNNNQQYQFVFSLRKILTENGLFRDNCENLGLWPVWNDPNTYLIDTSAYAFRRRFLVNVSSLWHNGYGADRLFLQAIRKNFGDKIYGCTKYHSLLYRLGSTKTSANPDYFKNGNEFMINKYGSEANMPWNNR